MKIGLFVCGLKGQLVLQALIKKKVDIKFVVTYQDVRTKDESTIKIETMCRKNNLRLFKKKENPPYDKVDKIFVIGWQFLLKGKRDKLVILHDSYLPEMKGFAPTVTSLIAGHKSLGATAFQPTDVVDAGPMYLRKRIQIEYPLKIYDALQLVAKTYVEIILEIVKNNPSPGPMPESPESFSVWRDSHDYFIDWSLGSNQIARFINAVGYPYDGAKAIYNDSFAVINQKIIIQEAEPTEEVNFSIRYPGKVWKPTGDHTNVICGVGMLKILKAIDAENHEPFQFKKLKARLK